MMTIISELLSNHFRRVLWAGALVGTLLGFLSVWVIASKFKTENLSVMNIEKQQQMPPKELPALDMRFYAELKAVPKRWHPAKTPEAEANPTNNDDGKQPAELPAHTDERLLESIARVLGKETPSSVTSEIDRTLPVSTGSPFALQLGGIFLQRSAADAYAQKLQSRGLSAHVVRGSDSDTGSISYRVRLHGYETRVDAEQAAAELAMQQHLAVIVVAQ